MIKVAGLSALAVDGRREKAEPDQENDQGPGPALPSPNAPGPVKGSLGASASLLPHPVIPLGPAFRAGTEDMLAPLRSVA